MPSKPKLVAGDYYEALPSPGFGAGDLWEGLPTFGLLNRSHVRGIVITPACDLANRKAETITYLPIISARDYLNSTAFIPDVTRAIRGFAQSAEVVASSCESTRGYELPSAAELERDIERISRVRASLASNAKRGVAVDRVIAGIQILHGLRNGALQTDLLKLKLALGDKDFEKTTEAIVKNNHSTDIHFLPADGKMENLSSMPEHSVVLFRYPITLPYALLELAEDMNQSNWGLSLQAHAAAYPSGRYLADLRPLRVSTVKSRFFSDLVARFVGLIVRLGSPDFSAKSVEEFAIQIRG